MRIDDNFYEQIREGYRMEKPMYSPEFIYNVMLDCWKANPSERPTFSQLVQKIGQKIPVSLQLQYVQINADNVPIHTDSQHVEFGGYDHFSERTN